MRIRQLSPKANLLLSSLSVIAGYVGVFTLGPYMLTILTVPAVILFVLSLRAIRNVSVPKERHLEPNFANMMVTTAVEPKDYPLCAHSCVVHSNGVAVAALAGRTVLTSIKYLQKMLRQREEEMQGELIFTAAVVERHLRRLERIQSITSGLTSGGNLSNQCYKQISKAEEVCDKLMQVREKLYGDTIVKLREFLETIPIEPKEITKSKEEEIKSMIKNKIPLVLTKVLDTLYSAEENAKQILENLESDWHDDLMFLWNDGHCKPVREPVPKERVKVPNLLYDGS